jgi:hypothetical protein
MTGVSLGDVLSGPAAGSGVIPIASEQVRARDPFGATIPRRSCCWAERQEILPGVGVVASEVPWAGIVVGRERALSGRGMKISMITWPGYLQSRLTPTLAFRQVDKLEIFRRLLDRGLEQPYVDTPDPGFYPPTSPHTSPLEVLSGPLSGNLADRTYLESDLKPVLEALSELASSEDGFDWRIVPFMGTPGDLTSFRVRADLGYPRLGRVAPVDLRWSSDPEDVRQRWGFVQDLTITENGSAVKNRITAMGAGTGEDQIRATAVNYNEWAAGYPLWEGSLNSSTGDDRTYETVYGKAQGALVSGAASEIRLSAIKVRGDLAPVVTSYGLGDDITIRVGETTTGRPATITGQLTGRTIEPAEQGRTEMVTLDVQGTVAA